MIGVYWFLLVLEFCVFLFGDYHSLSYFPQDELPAVDFGRSPISPSPSVWGMFNVQKFQQKK